MKKIVLITVSVLFYAGFNRVIAQETPDIIVPGTYYQDNIINNYVGTWKWTSGTDEFTITLVKKKKNNDEFSVDILSGGYRYVKNGLEVVNTLSDVNIDVNAINGPLASLSSYVRDGNRIGFSSRLYRAHRLGIGEAIGTYQCRLPRARFLPQSVSTRKPTRQIYFWLF